MWCILSAFLQSFTVYRAFRLMTLYQYTSLFLPYSGVLHSRHSARMRKHARYASGYVMIHSCRSPAAMQVLLRPAYSLMVHDHIRYWYDSEISRKHHLRFISIYDEYTHNPVQDNKVCRIYDNSRAVRPEHIPICDVSGRPCNIMSRMHDMTIIMPFMTSATTVQWELPRPLPLRHVKFRASAWRRERTWMQRICDDSFMPYSLSRRQGALALHMHTGAGQKHQTCMPMPYTHMDGNGSPCLHVRHARFANQRTEHETFPWPDLIKCMPVNGSVHTADITASNSHVRWCFHGIRIHGIRQQLCKSPAVPTYIA